jgi:hypothetical protein
MDRPNKNINIEIPFTSWKKIKMICLDEERSLQDVVREILEVTVNKKIKKLDIPDIKE